MSVHQTHLKRTVMTFHRKFIENEKIHINVMFYLDFRFPSKMNTAGKCNLKINLCSEPKNRSFFLILKILKIGKTPNHRHLARHKYVQDYRAVQSIIDLDQLLKVHLRWASHY